MTRRGLSLLEVLITALVIALAVTPLILSLRSSTRSVTGTREMLSAVAFAQRTLEELRRAAFRPPTPQPGVPSGLLPTIDEMVAAMNTSQAMDAAGKGNALTENNVTMVRRVKLIPDKVTDLQAGMPDVRVVQIEIAWRPSGRLLGVENKYQLNSLVGSGTQP